MVRSCYSFFLFSQLMLAIRIWRSREDSNKKENKANLHSWLFVTCMGLLFDWELAIDYTFPCSYIRIFCLFVFFFLFRAMTCANASQENILSNISCCTHLQYLSTGSQWFFLLNMGDLVRIQTSHIPTDWEAPSLHLMLEIGSNKNSCVTTHPV